MHIGDKYMDNLGIAIDEFMNQKAAKWKLKAKCDMEATLWGWLPIAYSDVESEYATELRALNKLEDQIIQIASIDGVPKATKTELTVVANATMDNPSVMKMDIESAVKVDVQYVTSWDVEDHVWMTIGELEFPAG